MKIMFLLSLVFISLAAQSDDNEILDLSKALQEHMIIYEKFHKMLAKSMPKWTVDKLQRVMLACNLVDDMSANTKEISLVFEYIDDSKESSLKKVLNQTDNACKPITQLCEALMEQCPGLSDYQCVRDGRDRFFAAHKST